MSAAAELRDLTVGDRDRFVERFASFPKMLWCCYFPFLICFGGERRRIVWEERYDCLCVYALSESGKGTFLNLVFPPLGPRPRDALAECVELMRQSNPNGTWRVMWADEQDVASIKSIGDANVREKGVEYFYRPSDLADLSGGRLESVRKAVRRFKNTYEFIVRPYTPDDEAECLALLQEWEDGQGLSYTRLLDPEYTRAALGRYDEFGRADLSGEVALISGRIRGFAFGGMMSPSLANAFILKADPAVRGLSHFMKLCQIRGFDGFDLVADAGDLGSPGLRRFKRSFAPALEIPTYSCGGPAK